MVKLKKKAQMKKTGKVEESHEDITAFTHKAEKRKNEQKEEQAPIKTKEVPKVENIIEQPKPPIPKANHLPKTTLLAKQFYFDVPSTHSKVNIKYSNFTESTFKPKNVLPVPSTKTQRVQASPNTISNPKRRSLERDTDILNPQTKLMKNDEPKPAPVILEEVKCGNEYFIIETDDFPVIQSNTAKCINDTNENAQIFGVQMDEKYHLKASSFIVFHCTNIVQFVGAGNVQPVHKHKADGIWWLHGTLLKSNAKVDVHVLNFEKPTKENEFYELQEYKLLFTHYDITTVVVTKLCVTNPSIDINIIA